MTIAITPGTKKIMSNFDGSKEKAMEKGFDFVRGGIYPWKIAQTEISNYRNCAKSKD